MMTEEGIKAIFEPKSVLLIGTSGIKKRAGLASPEIFTSVIHNMQRFYKGKTYILDLRGKLSGAVKSFAKVPKKQDLAVLMLPPELALKNVRKLVDKGVKAIVAVAGGYNREQRERLVGAATKRGARLLGLDAGMGVLNTSNGLCATFERDIMPERGGIALLSQSSSIGAAMLDWARFYRAGISKFACTGDGADVDEADLINYLASDGNTKVICVYIEDVGDGRKFVESLREAVKRKPVCILKAGAVREGVRRAISRTASLAGKDEIFDAAFKQGGAIRVRDLEELFDVAKALVSQPPMRDNRVAILSNARGASTLAAGAIHREGLMLAKLSNKAVREITNRYSDIKATNPVNMTADAKAEHYKFTLERILNDPNVDGVMVINMLKSRLLELKDLETIAKAAKKSKEKPVVDVAVGEVDHMLVREVLKGEEIPTYALPERAARALRALYQYGQVLEKVRE